MLVYFKCNIQYLSVKLIQLIEEKKNQIPRARKTVCGSENKMN